MSWKNGYTPRPAGGPRAYYCQVNRGFTASRGCAYVGSASAVGCRKIDLRRMDAVRAWFLLCPGAKVNAPERGFAPKDVTAS